MIDFNNKGFFKLKQNSEYAEKVTALLLEDEKIIDSYKSMRDGVVFTSKRIIAVNVQGLSEIPSFLETQIIPSVRVYKRCCFR